MENRIVTANRLAKCKYCNKWSKSSSELPCFKANPDFDFDSFYCGCLNCTKHDQGTKSCQCRHGERCGCNAGQGAIHKGCKCNNYDNDNH